MSTAIQMVVGTSVEETIQRFRAMPEIRDDAYRLERTRGGIRIRRRRAHPSIGDQIATVIELHVRLRAGPRGTRVRARVVQRPRWRGVVQASQRPTRGTLGTLLHDVIDVRRSLARWRRERSYLLNLASRTLLPVTVPKESTGPYRD